MVASVHRQVCIVAEARGWPQPSYATVYSVVKALDPGLVMLAHEGPKRYADQYELLYRREASRPNEMWQAATSARLSSRRWPRLLENSSPIVWRIPIRRNISHSGAAWFARPTWACTCSPVGRSAMSATRLSGPWPHPRVWTTCCTYQQRSRSTRNSLVLGGTPKSG
jgi:hypothetical protein